MDEWIIGLLEYGYRIGEILGMETGKSDYVVSDVYSYDEIAALLKRKRES